MNYIDIRMHGATIKNDKNLIRGFISLLNFSVFVNNDIRLQLHFKSKLLQTN